MKDTRLMWFTPEQFRRLELAARKMGKSKSRTIDELFAELIVEQKN